MNFRIQCLADIKENSVNIPYAPYAPEEIHWYVPAKLFKDSKIAVPEAEMNVLDLDFNLQRCWVES